MFQGFFTNILEDFCNQIYYVFLYFFLDSDEGQRDGFCERYYVL